MDCFETRSFTRSPNEAHLALAGAEQHLGRGSSLTVITQTIDGGSVAIGSVRANVRREQEVGHPERDASTVTTRLESPVELPFVVRRIPLP